MFKYLISIDPLGFIATSFRYSSLDQENEKFSHHVLPTTATLSGIYASAFESFEIQSLYLAGPFWARSDYPQNFFVPMPFNILNKNRVVRSFLTYDAQNNIWQDAQETNLAPSFQTSNAWVSIFQWDNIEKVERSPWDIISQAHPRLAHDERIPADDEYGALFVEYAIQMQPETCLVYLANMPLPNGFYRFGGEGHIVDIQTHDLDIKVQRLLSQPLGHQFALITPAIWGSNRFSFREPMKEQDGTVQPAWSRVAMLTGNPIPFRYRLGDRLSRGRYAVSPGSVYVLDKSLDMSWWEWPDEWFPREGYSLKRWGFGLALPQES